MQQIHNFQQLGLSEAICSAVCDMGYETPSDIQLQAIPFLLSGRDLIGQAQTGTGKTAAFAIPLLERIDPELLAPQAIVLCPTRELAVQVEKEIYKLSKYQKGIHSVAIYGGESIDKQIRALKKGVQIIVGTPGRVIDHLHRGTLQLDHVHMVVLDEADEMLNMGFRDDIEHILQRVPEEKQTVFFSATMPRPIMELTKRYQKNPQIVKIASKELTVERIEQYYCEVKEALKAPLIARFIQAHGYELSVIFCNMKRTADEVADSLGRLGIRAEVIHGDLSQAQRNKVMQQFRNGNCQVLVATDVAARGIDVENVEAVFNYDLPLDEEYYVHRIGRTGRAGRHGVAINLVSSRKDQQRVREIERYTKGKINKIEPPSNQDVLAFHLKKLQSEIENLRVERPQEALQTALHKLYETGIRPEDLAMVFLQKQLGHLLKAEEALHFKPEKTSFLSNDYDQDFSHPKRKSQHNRAPMTRLFLSVGKKDRIRPNDIVGAIAGETGIPGKSIGEIELLDNFSFVEVPQEVAQLVVRQMQNRQIKGKRVNIEVSEGSKKKRRPRIKQ
ncbi:ATP-dependent RNA helicase DeaD [Thermonema lapsum]|uniref:DEAD-box ATP-dependent RNA helicase RhpA n=1 Tax=Thermonema lapsum TaxID=28195 RepID=A0A846MNA5_9BACT|nr:DEAD/DEAH box helicase [Thermonema lapsum]NIK72984.1 ATP-dependent RNA helicase DeaD [Thermonema lapsum]